MMTNTIEIQYINTVIGELILGSFDQKLCLLDYKNRTKRNSIDYRLQKGLKAVYREKNNEMLDQTRHQLSEFLAGQRKDFNLPLILVGTDFQKKVWAALLKVPYGTTTSYLELAQNIGNVKAVRAVANANSANAMSVIIPCHRVIGAKGALVGYAGGLDAKKHLINREQTDS